MCEGDTLWIGHLLIRGICTWSTGDSTAQIMVTEPGTYVLTIEVCDIVYTVVYEITEIAPLSLELGPDTTICDSSVLVLDPGQGQYRYVWQDGSMQPTFTAWLPGTYSVEVTNECGSIASDTIQISFADTLKEDHFDLGKDTLICDGDTLILMICLLYTSPSPRDS